MKQALALGAAAVALAVAAAHAAGGTNPNALTLAVYGDSPYLDPAFPTLTNAEFLATPAFVNTINAEADDRSARRVAERLDADLVGSIQLGTENPTTTHALNSDGRPCRTASTSSRANHPLVMAGTCC